MLIEFNLGNFRSFWTTQSLKMTSLPIKELVEENSFQTPVKSLPRLLRSVIIYGPNAAGKSNLVRAAQFMKDFVLNSAKESQADESIKISPFLFISEGPDSPSEFEMLFISSGIRFQYGFEVTTTEVVHEWLFAYPEGRAQRWFERIYIQENDDYEWYFSTKFIGPKKIWKNATRKNALFLSTAIQLNNKQLKPVYSWFQNLVVVDANTMLFPSFTATKCHDSENKKHILEFMRTADISIDDIQLDKKKIGPEDLPYDWPEPLLELFQKDFEGKEITEIFFTHKVIDSQDEVRLPLQEESDGTQKLFAFAAPWLDIMKNGRVVFIDELDRSLHPHIMEFLIRLIHSPQTNKKNGQLIFTTHNTHLLSSSLFRRDQIWFVEKDETNATRLYALSDFSPRKHEALEKGYLAGRYGAIPFIKDLYFSTETDD